MHRNAENVAAKQGVWRDCCLKTGIAMAFMIRPRCSGTTSRSLSLALGFERVARELDSDPDAGADFMNERAKITKTGDGLDEGNQPRKRRSRPAAVNVFGAGGANPQIVEFAVTVSQSE